MLGEPAVERIGVKGHGWFGQVLFIPGRYRNNGCAAGKAQTKKENN